MRLRGASCTHHAPRRGSLITVAHDARHTIGCHASVNRSAGSCSPGALSIAIHFFFTTSYIQSS
eukprot:3812710-Heterocapsa_arctica.AAC.1